MNRGARLVTVAATAAVLTAGPRGGDSFRAGGEKIYQRAAYIMGTVATVKIYATDQRSADEHATAAFDELRRLEAIFTSYRDSELTRLNRDAAAQSVSVSDELFELLRLSSQYWESYGGAFDVTVGPAVRAWGFLGGFRRIPTASERAEVRDRTGMQYVRLDGERRAVAFAKPGIEIDVAGIAKGYAAEEAARLLQRRGVSRALVDLGGSSLFAVGAPPGQRSWPVRLIDPRPPHRDIQAIYLPAGFALSTSGTYEHAFRRGARSYSHIFDPRTAEPVRMEGSATAVSRSGAESEAAAKALLVLGSAKFPHNSDVCWVLVTVDRGRLRVEHSPEASAAMSGVP